MNTSECPRCHSPTPSLQEVRPEVQNFLIFHHSADGLIKRACPTCLQAMEDAAHDPSLIQNRMSPGELAKLQLWNKRIELIKEALTLMKAEKFSEAVPKYEEYLQVIEKVIGVPSADLNAQSFIVSGRAEELPIYSLVLWDIIVCNDGVNEAAQQAAATKMIQLVKGTNLRKTLSDRAKKYVRKAKNKKFIKKLLKDFREDRGCFVATFAYESVDHPQVKIFRNFRDTVLLKNFFGRVLIETYYLVGPSIVFILKQFPHSQRVSRGFLDWLSRRL